MLRKRLVRLSLLLCIMFCCLLAGYMVSYENFEGASGSGNSVGLVFDEKVVVLASGAVLFLFAYLLGRKSR